MNGKWVGDWVYRLYDADGTLLYIGCTENLEARRIQHTGYQQWWPMVASYRLTGPFETRLAALTAERDAIKAEQPQFNIHHNPNRRPLSLDEFWHCSTERLRIHPAPA